MRSCPVENKLGHRDFQIRKEGPELGHYPSAEIRTPKEHFSAMVLECRAAAAVEEGAQQTGGCSMTIVADLLLFSGLASFVTGIMLALQACLISRAPAHAAPADTMLRGLGRAPFRVARG
jgi:hypothetical protein